VWPGITATAIFRPVASWNEFLFAMIHSGRKITTRGPMAAVGVAASIPIIVFTVLIQKHLVRGLTYGAVK
jgi:multiple sugar transport system permease protein